MKKLFVLIFLLTGSLSLKAQEPDQIKIYTWEEAKFADPDTIYGLTLFKMKLSELPAELSKYKQLRVLDLQKNKLTKLPSFIGEFEHLEVLNVERNDLENFPVQICRLSKIQRLILNRNQFESIPECIAYMKGLRYLDLFDTPIRKLPNSLTKLDHLEEIDFTGIRFSPTFQEKWIELLPNVKLVFDPPCDCMN